MTARCFFPDCGARILGDCLGCQRDLPPERILGEFMDAPSVIILAAERIRFSPERLAAFQKAIDENAPGIGDAAEFLDYLIERAGGRSQ